MLTKGEISHTEKLLQELKAEKEKLEQVIALLEGIVRAHGPPLPAKRRGRKFMGAVERQEVSKRMKRYWEMSRNPAGTG